MKRKKTVILFKGYYQCLLFLEQKESFGLNKKSQDDEQNREM